MKIEPLRSEIEVEISKEKKCRFICEWNKFDRSVVELIFYDDTSLYEIAKAIMSCFESEELNIRLINSKFYKNKVRVSKDNLKSLSESEILSVIAYQIKLESDK